VVLIGPLALLQAEEPMPLAAYAVATLLGAILVWVLLGRELLHEAYGAMAPAFFAASASTVLALATVISLGYQTRFFVRHDLREVGTAGERVPVMPESLVVAARAILRANDRWALVTPVGRCQDDQYRHFWLAFRLFPNVPDCRSPEIEIFFRMPAPPDSTVVNAASDWAIVRR
jgi:hypothetical protein